MGQPKYKVKRTQGSRRRKNFNECRRAAGDVSRYLEVGVAEGWSGRWWIDKCLKKNGGEYVGIDVWWDWKKDGISGEQMRERAVKNLEVEGFDGVKLLDGRSWVHLPQLEPGFDVIYIDGDHGRLPVLGDSCLAWKLLRKGGVLLWDDYGIRRQGRPVKKAVDCFLDVCAKQWEPVVNNWQRGVKKTV